MSLARVTIVPRETFAKTSAVITFTTTRAITSFGISITTKSIVGRWAFNQGAIWASETIITFATITVFCIPCTIVFSSYIFIYIKWDVVLCEFLQARLTTYTSSLLFIILFAICFIILIYTHSLTPWIVIQTKSTVYSYYFNYS